LLTERGPYYRGRSAIELAESASLEDVAALLWQVDERDVFTPAAPRCGKNFKALDRLLSSEAGVDRAIAHFPFLEHANPRSYNLSPGCMARTGADVVRWLAAIMLGQGTAHTDPIHVQFGRVLGLTKELTDLVRRLLVLAADNGFEQSTFAVRAVASMGVTPWRAVATGLAVATGRRSKLENSDALRRFIAEIIATEAPEEPVMRRIREGEALPGFVSPVYPKGDPRAGAVFEYCDRALAQDVAYKRLKRALDLTRELHDIKPGFALAGTFAAARLGLGTRGTPASVIPTQAPYLIGRSIGWIAHAIEQYKAGEAGHRELLYRGPLPEAQ
jgi:citrate synthase